MSVHSIQQNKLRSFLSVLGITIGIFCIISVYALVHSMEKSLNNQFTKFGTDVLFVQKWPWDEFGEGYPWWKYLGRPVTSPAEAQYLEEKVSRDKVKAVAYVFNKNTDVKTAEFAVKNAKINCISYEYGQIQDVNIAEGRYFTPEECANAQSICVIGHGVAQVLFPGTSPIGKQVRIGNGVCTVVGVCPYEGNSMIDNSTDNVVFVPVKWGMGVFSYRESEEAQIMLKAAEGVSLDDLRVEISQIMRGYRKIHPGADDNFAVNKMSMITDAISELFGQIKKIGLIIGAFAMLVGCFGVANIMFVSVKERTQEIGIHKALGAHNWFIQLLFLLESVWLSILGGLLGIGIVALVLWALNAAVADSLGAGASLTLGYEDASIGIGASVIVGLIAGYIPAVSASKMDPVEAIRSK